MPTIEGGCFCGAVRYRASAAPTTSLICHCRSCRRAAAAPAAPWVTFERAAFALTAGELSLFRSSPPVRRGFCARCGTPLTYEHDERPGEIDVTTASLDDPEALPPTYHIQLGDDLSWLKFGDGLPAYRGWKREG
ncbi:MAG TPA: GFA family protein [Caulobacteraceae bacterium]